MPSKLWGYLAAIGGVLLAIISFGQVKKSQGKAEVIAESNESELKAIKEKNERVTEVKKHNRRITRKQLFDGLRKQSTKSSD